MCAPDLPCVLRSSSCRPAGVSFAYGRVGMGRSSAAKLVLSTDRLMQSLQASARKGAPEAEKYHSSGETVHLKSKIVVAAARPLSGIRRPRPVDTLFAVSKAVGAGHSLTEMLRQATRELVRALAADFGSVWRVDPNDRELHPVAGFRRPSGRVGMAAAEGSTTWLASAAAHVGEVIYSSNSARDPRFTPLLRLLPHRSVLIQPLRVGGQLAGIFAFAWTRERHRFNDVQLRLVDAVTQQAAIAIENAELLAEVRAFNEQLERRVRDRTRELKRASAALRASREQLRALGAHLEGVRERERMRISRAIHDELGQALTALKIDLARASLGDPALDSATLTAAIDDMVGDVRRIASELRPQILDDVGLVAALEWHALEFEKRTGIKCRFQRTGDGEEERVDADRSTALFRIFQEMLTNVARHAQATRVSIACAIDAGVVRLAVRDNGVGLSENTDSRRRGLGILGMQERAMMFGGKVAIGVAAGRGTAVRVRIPLPGRETSS
jgi:signal transduction histidine kinase